MFWVGQETSQKFANLYQSLCYEQDAIVQLVSFAETNLDDLVNSVLEQAEWNRPPVDAVEIARRLGATVASDARLVNRARFQRLANRPTIFLRPEARPERLQWAAAHELGEALADRLAWGLDDPSVEVVGRQRESLASLFAARLLLPGRWFSVDVEQFGTNLKELKSKYSTASYELLAQRWLDYARDEQRFVSIYDHGRLTRRRYGHAVGGLPIEVSRLEQALQVRVFQSGQMAARSFCGWELVCWPIHEPTWKREIVLARQMQFGMCDDSRWGE
jgi:IrrE N-terminal-like domain